MDSIGSQGDGSAQVLCDSEEKQLEVLEYIRDYYHYDAFPIVVD